MGLYRAQYLAKLILFGIFIFAAEAAIEIFEAAKGDNQSQQHKQDN
jgi:hypothetical protein